MKSVRMVFALLLTFLLVLGPTPVIACEIDPPTYTIESEINGLSLVGHLDTPDHATDIVVQGDYAYICDRSALRIIDISVPTAPEEVGAFTALGSSCSALAVEDDYAYVGTGMALKIIDISTPESPTQAGQVSLYINYGVDVQGDYAYVVDYDSQNSYQSRLYTIDIATKTAPFVVVSKVFSTYLNDVDVSGNYAYLANHDNGLRVIDISVPSSLSEVGFLDSPTASRGVTVIGDLVYLAEGDGLRIVDVSDPASPSLLSFFHTSANAEKCVVYSGYAYIATHNTGIVMVNVQNPSAPILVDIYDTAGNANDVEAANGLIYVADYDNGLVILKPGFPIFLPMVIK